MNSNNTEEGNKYVVEYILYALQYSADLSGYITERS